MPSSNPTPSSIELLVHLLQTASEQAEATTHLARLDPVALDYLQTRASDLHRRAIGEARDLLDIALDSLEHLLSPECQRRLIERADDELASAQRWSALAANARLTVDADTPAARATSWFRRH